MENEIKSQFKGQVLDRVYRVWLTRRFLPVLLAEIIVLSLVLYGLSKLIFVQRILENTIRVLLNNPGNIFSFLYLTFAQSALMEKILSLGLIVLLALLLRQITQGLLRYILVKENYFGKIEPR